jgi:hypothetical protein
VLAIEWPDRLTRPIQGATIVELEITGESTRCIKIGDT